MSHPEVDDPHPLADLTAFERDVLTVLAHEGPSYGLAIKRAVSAARDEEVNHGRLYPNLDGLVEKGFIEKGEFDKRTNSYELTPEAETALEEYASWVETSLTNGDSTTHS